MWPQKTTPSLLTVTPGRPGYENVTFLSSTKLSKWRGVSPEAWASIGGICSVPWLGGSATCIKEHLPCQWCPRGDHWRWQLWPDLGGRERSGPGTWPPPQRQRTPVKWKERGGGIKYIKAISCRYEEVM